MADAAAFLPDVSFPECTARVMRAERTFWEKATAIHVFCKQGALDGERFSRHWSDITQLDDHGIVNRALSEPDLAQAVAEHKSMFFREKDADGTVIDSAVAVNGSSSLFQKERRTPPSRPTIRR